MTRCTKRSMITAEQLKDIQQRCQDLHRYLDIDAKKIEFEEEQLRTQAPDFWDDAKRAQEQMKKVKGIEKWLKGYEQARLCTDELACAAPLLEFLGFFEDFHSRSWSSELELENGIDIFFSRILNAETQRRRGSWRVEG